MEVTLSKNAEKQLKKVPEHVRAKLMYWINQVSEYGIEKVRRVPGFHDEPLRGKRSGQRSIRLSKAWRAIYKIVDGIIVIEVNKHDY